jgi:hypothetical protein
MGHSEYDAGVKDRRPWNADRKIGAKRALKPQQVWAIRFWLDREHRLRDRAIFDLAIDSKLRGGARSAYADTVAGTLRRVVLVLRRIDLVAQTPAPLVGRRGMINSYGRAHLAAD